MPLDDHAHPLAGQLRIDNIAVAVGDLGAMVDWYRTVLGFSVAERGRFDELNADYAMLDGAGIRVELVGRPGTGQRAVDRTMPPHHLGVLGWKALVLQAEDLAAVTALLVDRGTDMVWADQPISAYRRSTMIRDREGNLIHILGPVSVGADV